MRENENGAGRQTVATIRIGEYDYETDEDGTIRVGGHRYFLDRTRPVKINGVKGLEGTINGSWVPVIAQPGFFQCKPPDDLGIPMSEDEARQVAGVFQMRVEEILWPPPSPAPAPEAPRPSDEAHIVTDVTEALTRRLTEGRAVYGPLVLATDTRDFVEEAWEEGIDLLVYLAAARRVRDGLREQLRQKTAEAANLRASTAELMAQRDEARRLYCEKMPTYIGGQTDQSTPSTYRVILHHDPAQHALEQGWAGLYPAPVNSPKKPDARGGR